MPITDYKRTTSPEEEGKSYAVNKVTGITELKTALVKLRDGHGQELIKIVFIVPGGEVYFVDEKSLNLRTAQTWAKTQILERFGMKNPEQEASSVPEIPEP